MSHAADIAQHHKACGVEHGELGKRVAHVAPGEGTRSQWVLGDLVTNKVPSHKTGGAYSLFEATTPPGAGPPPHVHHREDEALYILEGEYEFLVDGRTLGAQIGSLIYVPKGALHAHKNVGEGVGRMLLTQTPGGLYELFFQKVGIGPVDGDDGGSLLSEDRLDMASITVIAAEYGIEIPPSLAEKVS
jgi:quercetin dioxygenase-like cupin family protein